MRFKAGECLSEMLRRATMPAALEANRTLNEFVGAASRPQFLQASERFGKPMSEAVMPQVADIKKLSSVPSAPEASAVGKGVLGSAGTSL